MVLFVILLITLILLLLFVITAVGAGGAIFIVVFGDVIVCIALIALIMRWILKKRK